MFDTAEAALLEKQPLATIVSLGQVVQSGHDHAGDTVTWRSCEIRQLIQYHVASFRSPNLWPLSP